jgi:hypothetical protein
MAVDASRPDKTVDPYRWGGKNPVAELGIGFGREDERKIHMAWGRGDWK